MNKAEMIKAIANEIQIPETTIELVVNAEHKLIKETVMAGDNVKYVGFGTFEARKQSERIIKNPKTQEETIVEAKMVPKFNASSKFKKEVAETLLVK